MSIIFLAPLIMVAVVVKAGGRHPAIITLAGGGTFAGFMVVLQPNAFAFILVGAVGLVLGHGGRGYPGKYLRLLHSAHPLVPVAS